MSASAAAAMISYTFCCSCRPSSVDGSVAFWRGIMYTEQESNHLQVMRRALRFSDAKECPGLNANCLS
eukprot:1157179-Pelagomonas_calceolata.AAC.7